MIGWLLNLVYLGLLVLVSPVLAYRAVRQGKYRHGLAEKLFGRGVHRVATGRCVWLHAVSVGEVLLLKPVIEELRRQSGVEIWLSTTTQTGHAVAREKYPECQVLYFPVDFTWSVRAALERVRPDVIGLVELELWPNFIRAAAGRGIPLVLINGRIGERSFRGYRLVRFLMRRVIGRLSAIGMQTPEYARRIIELGAPRERVTVTGSVKFDGVRLEQDTTRLAALRAELEIASHERVLLAGSTHAPEERVVLDCYAELQREFPELRLLIAPRHQERFDEVAALITAAGWPLGRRSQRKATSIDHREARRRPRSSDTCPEVILLDTLGELSDCWGLAEIAFVGGSLSQRGGQNMLEPCAAGAAVVVGPNTWNFRHAVELLVDAGGLVTVSDADELPRALRRLLSDASAADTLRSAARDAIKSQQGATRQTVAMLLDALRESGANSTSRSVADLTDERNVRTAA